MSYSFWEYLTLVVPVQVLVYEVSIQVTQDCSHLSAVILRDQPGGSGSRLTHLAAGWRLLFLTTEPFAKVKTWKLSSKWLPGTAGYFVPERLVSVSGLFCITANFNPIQYLLTNINCCQPRGSPLISYFFLFEEANEC